MHVKDGEITQIEGDPDSPILRGRLCPKGAAVTAFAGHTRRMAAVAGGALLLAGAAFERWSVFRAGFLSAGDPKYTVMPQRERLRERCGA